MSLIRLAGLETEFSEEIIVKFSDNFFFSDFSFQNIILLFSELIVKQEWRTATKQ